MKKKSTLLFVCIAMLAMQQSFSQTAYRSITSGVWSDFNVWDRTTNVYNPTPTWVPATSGQLPTSNNIVFVRNGHSVTTDGTKSCLNLTIESGGTLLPGSNTLRVGVPSSSLGGGFIDTLRVDGTLGGPGSTFGLELGSQCASLWITGNGNMQVGRIRPNNGNVNYVGSASANAAPGARILIDRNVLLDVSGNYALSALNSTPSVNDSVSVTIFAGRTVTVTNANSYFHNDLTTATAGKYAYNINGTLDLTANTSTLGGTKFSPYGNAASAITLNVNGLLKLGGYFKADTVATSLGSLNLNINNGGVIDASLTSKLIVGTVGAATATPNIYFKISGNGSLKRTVSNDGTKTVFPIGTSSYTPVTISGTTGAAEVFSVTLKDAFTNPAPANTLQKEWNISEATAGGNADTLRFQWTIADQAASGFTGANAVFVGQWDGSAWVFTPASVSGTGTPADPYVAKSAAFTSFGLFILSNSGTAPVLFVNVKAYQKANGIQVEFGNATESDMLNYEIQQSTDGRSFTTLASLLPKTNNGILNSYVYFDAVTNNGNNFYRIKATERSGSIKYSSVLNVRLSGNSGISVYPNPVKGKILNIQLENLDKAVYVANLYNQLGQIVYSKRMVHDGRTASFVLDVPASISKGLYNLQISSDNFKIIKNVIVE